MVPIRIMNPILEQLDRAENLTLCGGRKMYRLTIWKIKIINILRVKFLLSFLAFLFVFQVAEASKIRCVDLLSARSTTVYHQLLKDLASYKHEGEYSLAVSAAENERSRTKNVIVDIARLSPLDSRDIELIQQIVIEGGMKGTPSESEIEAAIQFNRENSWNKTIPSEDSKPPTIPELSVERPPIRDVLGSVSQATSPEAVYSATVSYISNLPEYIPYRKTLHGIVSKLGDILLGQTKTDYRSGKIVRSNQGIKNYISRQLEEDPYLLNDALRFYSQLRLIDRASVLNRKTEQRDVWDQSRENLWDLALANCNGDPMRALRTLEVFGHDDVAQMIGPIPNSKIRDQIYLLNRFLPERISHLYTPGALPGLEIPKKFIGEFGSLFEKYDAIEPSQGHLSENFRAANYHFLGGALIATELIGAGYGRVAGIKVPVLIAKTLAFLYRKISFEQYITGKPLQLYRAGYKKTGVQVSKPDGWSEQDFEMAKLDLDIYFLIHKMTLYQHQRGAEWAYEKLGL